MKLVQYLIVALSCLVITIHIKSSQSNNPRALLLDAAPKVIERGPHHRVWQQTALETNFAGQVITRTRSYTELTTGLHFLENGEWKESKAEIEILPNNAGAIAAKGQHKVIFPPEIKSGLIELQTPDGQWLRSRVWGLAYFDTSTSECVLLAEVKESDGQLEPVLNFCRTERQA